MKVLILTLFAALLLSLSAAQDAPEGFPVTVTDAYGKKLTFDAPPTRVFCMYTDCMQHMAALGLVPAGGFEWDIRISSSPFTFGERAAEIIPFVWDGDGPDLEAILAFGPDLLVHGPWQVDDPAYATLLAAQPSYGSIGPYADYSGWNLADDATWANYTADFINMGRIFGLEDRANDFAARVRDRYLAYRALVPEDMTYVRVRLETDKTIGAPVCLPLLEGIGACQALGDEWVITTVEAILDLDPDVIFVEASPDREVDLEAWNAVPLWTDLEAVQSGRVHVVGYDTFYDATPLSLSNTLDVLVPLLYPETFPEPLTDEQVQEILVSKN